MAGGLNEGGFGGGGRTLSSAELYNPIYGRWSTTASMNHTRFGQTATLMNGGWSGDRWTYRESEIYEPKPAGWVPTGSLSTSRTYQTATLLVDGDVLVAGGTGYDHGPLAELRGLQLRGRATGFDLDGVDEFPDRVGGDVEQHNLSPSLTTELRRFMSLASRLKGPILRTLPRPMAVHLDLSLRVPTARSSCGLPLSIRD